MPRDSNCRMSMLVTLLLDLENKERGGEEGEGEGEEEHCIHRERKLENNFISCPMDNASAIVRGL